MKTAKHKTGNGHADPTQWAYEQIRALIINGKLCAGEKLNQVKLAVELGLSRTPVVKALHQLESQGLIDRTPQKGFRVHKLTIGELDHLFALRASLEALVVEDIARRVTDEQLAELEALFSPFDGQASEGQRALYREADIAFHNRLMSLCGSDLVKRVDDSFQVLNRTLIAGLLRDMTETLPEHRAILQGLRDRQPAAARQAVEEHTSRTRALIQRTVRQLEELGVAATTLTIEASLAAVGGKERR